MPTDNQNLIAIHQKRLNILQEQAAKYGSLSVPPHILMEIDELEEKIAELQAGGGQATPTTNQQPTEVTTTDDPNVSYHTGNVRKLLTAAFPNPDDFDTFCFDNFPEVSTSFGTGMSHTQKIQRLIEFCSAHLRFGELLDLVKDENEAQYNRFAGKLTR